MDEVDNGPFFKLLNLEKKYGKYTNHLQYRTECKARNVISGGFKLKKSSNIGYVSENFEEEWNKLLDDCSHGLQRLLLDEVSVVLSSLEEQRRAFVANLEEQQYSAYMGSIRTIVSRIESAMKDKHDRKLSTLCGTENDDATSGAVAEAIFGHVLGSPQERNESVQELQTTHVVGGQDVDDSENLARNAMATRSVGATTSGLNRVNEHFEETVEVDSARERTSLSFG